MTRLTVDELMEALDRQKEKPLVQVEKPKKMAKIVKQQVKRPAQSRSWYVYVLMGIVAAFAYVCLGLGWLIGAVGDAIYEVGKRAHEAKWNIQS